MKVLRRHTSTPPILLDTLNQANDCDIIDLDTTTRGSTRSSVISFLKQSGRRTSKQLDQTTQNLKLKLDNLTSKETKLDSKFNNLKEEPLNPSSSSYSSLSSLSITDSAFLETVLVDNKRQPNTKRHKTIKNNKNNKK